MPTMRKEKEMGCVGMTTPVGPKAIFRVASCGWSTSNSMIAVTSFATASCTEYA